MDIRILRYLGGAEYLNINKYLLISFCNSMLLESPKNFTDFELLDTGGGFRLERWGEVILSAAGPANYLAKIRCRMPSGKRRAQFFKIGGWGR